MAIVRNLRDVFYWAIMSLLFVCRFLFTWVYCVVSYGAFHALVDRLRHMPAHFTRGYFAALAFLTLGGFISGAAWWTTLRSGRTQRIWVILFSLGSVLTWGFSGGLTVSYPLATGFIMVPTLGGLLVFLLPYRLRLSVRISSYRVGSPDQKYECNAATSRSLRSRAYWALMVLLSASRLAIIWFYYVVFKAAAEVLLDEIRQSSFPTKPTESWMIAGEVILFFIAAAAGWTAFRNSRAHRIWVVIASLLSLAAAFIFFEDRSTRPGGSPWEILVITALGGILLYLLPYRLQWSVAIFSFRVKKPHEVSRQLHFSV